MSVISYKQSSEEEINKRIVNSSVEGEIVYKFAES